MKKNIFLIACLFLAAGFAKAAKVDTVETYSDVMHKKIKAIVIMPADYEQGKQFPVVYLLHGAGGNYKQFYDLNHAIADWADHYHLMIVCADGGVTSWYWDSPVDPNFKYETYVSKELVGYIDKNYKTIKNKTGRAISGLSMGGQGAFYLAMRHQDIYGAVGSMSGGVDIRPFPNNWDMAKRLGSYDQNPDIWEKTTVTNLLYLIKPNSLAITFDCGTDDFFYRLNCILHNKMVERNIPHDFTSRPGAHTSEYWANSVVYHLMFLIIILRKTCRRRKMREEINLYMKLMTDVKHRLNFIDLILGKSNTTGSIETNTEFCCLQLRKILELISLGSLVMNKSEFENQNVKYEKFWNSRLILQDIERVNPDFYPKPIAIDLENSTPENAMLYDMKDGFLTKQEFINVYERCGKILHNENPYGNKIDYDYYGKQIKIWSERIIFLLKLHMIKLYKGDGFFLVYVYNAADNNVHAVHYPAPKN